MGHPKKTFLQKSQIGHMDMPAKYGEPSSRGKNLCDAAYDAYNQPILMANSWQIELSDSQGTASFQGSSSLFPSTKMYCEHLF